MVKGGTSLDVKAYRLGWISFILAIVALAIGVFTVKDQLVYYFSISSITAA
jgi:hypothetical protein